MAITVNNLNIEDLTNYIVEEITVRSVPQRTLNMQLISKRPGAKLTALEWGTKEINIRGRIFSTTVSGVRGLLDTLQQNFATPSLILSIDTDRSYTANLQSLDVPTQFYNNSMFQYDAKFIAIDPFAYASQITASGTVTSGTVTYSGSITISGTVFAVPTLSIVPRGANAGDSGIRSVLITHTPTGETMTISGTFNYAVPFIVDYNNFLTTVSGVARDYTGIFSRFQPGVVPYTITVNSGVKNSFNWVWSYQPRYYN